MDLNQLIAEASAGALLTLPSGEFEGPVTVNKPLRLLGKNTTLWAKKGAVLEINSNGVSIENLRVELTEGNLSDTAICAACDASVRNVEVLGGVKGFGAEDGAFDVPRTIELGDFLADSENTFLLTVNVPDKTEIVCDIRELKFSPSTLEPGRNDVTVTVSGISAQTFLYAEILFKTKFTRRICITGKPKTTAKEAVLKQVFTAPEREAPKPLPHPADDVSEQTALVSQTDVISMTQSPNTSLPALAMRRGQRVSLSQYIGSRFEVFFTCEKPRGTDIDPYIFLLDENERSLGDAGLIFFGNERSENGEAVYFPADGHLEIDLAKTDYRVQKIALAYSVYAGDAKNNFAAVKEPRVSIRAGGERISFIMDGLSTEATVVALEFYLYKGEWKISAVGSGYRDGMASLCNRYGIEVEK